MVLVVVGGGSLTQRAIEARDLVLQPCQLL